MLQRGDSDIGWADLYIIPDRARSYEELELKKNLVRGATRNQIRSFFEHRSKGGGGHFHVQKFWSKFCMILKAFWQHKIDIKRLFFNNVQKNHGFGSGWHRTPYEEKNENVWEDHVSLM